MDAHTHARARAHTHTHTHTHTHSEREADRHTDTNTWSDLTATIHVFHINKIYKLLWDLRLKSPSEVQHVNKIKFRYHRYI